MAKTYFGYEQRAPKKGVDYTGVGLETVDNISKVFQDRADKRAAIDQVTDSSKKVVESTPLGEFDGINSFSLAHAAKVQESMLDAEEQLKRGKMRPEDYLRFTNNITNGTKDAYDVIDMWNQNYTESMARLQNDESSAMEGWAMEQLEQFGKISNSEMYFDPKTGLVSVKKKDGDPNDPTANISIREFGKRMGKRYDKFKVNDNVESQVDKMGAFITSEMSNGIKTLEDVKNSENYVNQRDTFIQSLMTNDDNIASILLDDMLQDPNGNKYTLQSNPDELKDGEILVEMDHDSGRMKFMNLDSFKDDVKKHLTTKFDAMVDHKETAYEPRTYRPPAKNNWQSGKDYELQQSMGYIKGMELMIDGSLSAAEGSAQNLMAGMNKYYEANGIDKYINSVTKTPGGKSISIEIFDGYETETVDIPIEGRSKYDIVNEMFNYLAPVKNTSFSEAINQYQQTEGGFKPMGVTGGEFNVARNLGDVEPYGLELPTDSKGGTLATQLEDVSDFKPSTMTTQTRQVLSTAFSGYDIPFNVTRVDEFGRDPVTIRIGDGDDAFEVTVNYGSKSDMGDLREAVDQAIREGINWYNKNK